MARYGAGMRRRTCGARCNWPGAVLLALAIWPCVAGWSATVGVVAWLGFISAGALLVALLLPYAPRLLFRSSLLAAVAALAGLVTFLR